MFGPVALFVTSPGPFSSSGSTIEQPLRPCLCEIANLRLFSLAARGRVSENTPSRLLVNKGNAPERCVLIGNLLGVAVGVGLWNASHVRATPPGRLCEKGAPVVRRGTQSYGPRFLRGSRATEQSSGEKEAPLEYL